MLATGDIQNGVEHLALAVAVCGQPHNLLGVFQSTLPPQIYHLLLQNLEVNLHRFPVWLKNQLMSAGLEPVLSHTEKQIKHRITNVFP